MKIRSTVGLEPLNGFQGNKNVASLPVNQPTEAIDALPIPMEIDGDTLANDIETAVNDVSTVVPVDLESELREFLESDTTSLAAAAADDVGIDQMLMA